MNLHDPPAKTAPRSASRLVLEIALAPGDDTAPLRVLSLLTRRRCRIERAGFALADDRDAPRLHVEMAVPRGREATVQRWVAALVPVHGVERVDS